MFRIHRDLPSAVLLILSLAVAPSLARAQGGAASRAQAAKRVVDGIGAARTSLKASDFTSALRHAEAAFTEAERSLAGTDSRRVEVSQLVTELRVARAIRAGDLPGALARSEEAVTLFQGSLPPGHPARTKALLGLAELLLAMNRPADAMVRYDQTANESERAKRKDGERVVALLMAAFLRLDRDAREQAVIPTLTAKVRDLGNADAKVRDQVIRPVAQKIWQALQRRAQEAPAADGAAADAADLRFRRDLDRVRTLLAQAGASDALTAWGDLWLLKFQYDRSRFDAAEATLKGLTPYVKGAGKALDPTFGAEYWSFVGLLRTERGDFVRALEAHETELKLRRGEVWGTHRTLNSLGQLWLRLGDYRAARKVLQESVEIYASDPFLKNDPIRPLALTQLAKAIEGTDELDEAARLHREALALAKSAPKPDPSTICLCHNNLGTNRFAAGDLDAAKAEFEEARKLATKTFGEAHIRVAEVDVNLGWVARTRGQAEEAERLFRSALKIIGTEWQESHRHAEVLGYLASVLGPTGRVLEAKDSIEQALSHREAALRRTLRSALSDRERLAIVQEMRFHPESRGWPGVLDTYLNLGPTLKIADEAQYGHLLTWKGATARRSLASLSTLEDDPEVRRLASTREKALRELRAAAAETPSRRQRQAHEERLVVLEETINDLERQLRQKSRRFAQEAGDEDVSPTAVRAAVPEGWALLDVMEIRRPGAFQPGTPIGQDRRYLGYLVRPDRPIVRLDLGDAEPIDRAIRDFHLVLDAPGDDYADSTRRLAGLIRDPLLPHLNGVSGLILAGDGLLHRLPLAALPGTKAGSFWVEDLAFATVPTAQSLVVRRRDRPRSSGALIVGDVDYGPLSGEYPPLPKTRTEAETIAQAFQATHPGVVPDHLTRGKASEPALRALLPARRFVHLATHGFFHARSIAATSSGTFGVLAQLDSGLVLARAKAGPAGNPDDDQRLTAEEMGRMDLRRVELMVLSACSSGLGHISSGQGVIGLLGALDRAGVGTVICSLWKVDDSATAALMTAFYRHHWGRPSALGPALALQSAQRELIRGGPTFSHPRFWAAFFVSGDPLGHPAADTARGPVGGRAGGPIR